MAVEDAGNVELILQKIRHIITALNDNSALGISNAQALRCLIILYVVNIDPKYEYMGELDEADKLRYFTIGELKKVSKKKGTAYPIQFTGPRAIEPYEKCERDGYVKIKHEPGNRTSFALFEKGKEHCRNLVEHMYDEKYQQGDPISTGNQATDKITVLNDLLSVDQFVERREIKVILNKYPVFIGREIEFEKLNRFLENPTRSVMLITGEGGTGKTRLVLEFIRRLQDSKDYKYKQHIYFIDPYKETYPAYLPSDSLLILDDAERKSTYLNHIIDLVLHYGGPNRSKLLLIERSIFRAHIENAIKEKNCEFDTLYLERGDIVKFLKQNFSSIDEYICKEIEQDCRGSFDYAAAHAEYYRNGGKLSGLKDVLSWKTGRYIKDIALRTKSDVADVEYIIQLLSMIVPLDWDLDKDYFKKEFPNIFDTMEKILYGARNTYEDSIILIENNSIILIKPELLGDFFRFNALGNSRLQNALWNLIPYTPMRIVYNIRTTGDVDDSMKKELLFKVWNLLNEKRGGSPEFIIAIGYFTGNIRHYLGPELLNSRKPNIDNWLECYYKFYDISHSENLEGYLTMALFNLCSHYSGEKNFEQLDRTLQYFNILYRKYGGEPFETLQGFIIGAVQDPNPKVMEKYLDKLRLLYTRYPSDLILPYADLLYSTYKCHADNDNVPRPKLLYEYIKKLRQLYQQYSNGARGHERLAVILINALVTSIMLFSKDLLVDFVKKDIKELYNLYKMHHGPEIKTHVKIALDCVNHYCKDSNLQEIDHELKYMKDSTSELDFSLKFNQQEFVNNKDRGEAIKKLWVNLVDFKIQKLERTRLFAIVLDDDVLPTIYNIEGTFKEVFVDGHIFLEFTIKSVHSGEKSLRILLCPTRIKNDHLLRTMIENIIDQKTDDVTGLSINDATVALTNKKGILISNNLFLSTSQKEILQEKEKCMVILFTGSFGILSLAYEIIVTAPEEVIKRKKLENCPYCLKRNWI